MVNSNNNNKAATLATTNSKAKNSKQQVKQQRQTVGVVVMSGTTTWGSISSAQQKQQQQQEQQQQTPLGEQEEQQQQQEQEKQQQAKKNRCKNSQKPDNNNKTNNEKTGADNKESNNNNNVANKMKNVNRNDMLDENVKTTTKLIQTTTATQTISAVNSNNNNSSDNIEANSCATSNDNETKIRKNLEEQLQCKTTTNVNKINNNRTVSNKNKNSADKNSKTNSKTRSENKQKQQPGTQQADNNNKISNKKNNNNKNKNDSKISTNTKNKIQWKRIEKRNSVIFSTNHHYNNYNNYNNSNSSSNQKNKNNKYHIPVSSTPSTITDEDYYDEDRDYDLYDLCFDNSNNNTADDTDSLPSQDFQQNKYTTRRQQQQRHENKNTKKLPSASDLLTAALMVPCKKCNKVKAFGISGAFGNPKQFRKSKSCLGDGGAGRGEADETGLVSERNSIISMNSLMEAWQDLGGSNVGNSKNKNNKNQRPQQYSRSHSDRRTSFDRVFAERNKDFVPIVQPTRPVLASSNIERVLSDTTKLVIIERVGQARYTYPIMQCGTLDAHTESSYHYQQRSNRMDVYQIDDGFHSDGGTETPPPSPSSGSSIASASDHGSLESVDTGGTQRLAVLSFEQVRKLHDVMDEKVAIHGRGNFPTLEVPLKDLVNLVRRKLEADVSAGGAGVIVKDVRLNGGAASHVLASEDQPYNDLDLIYAIELTSSRHFDRVKTAVLNTLLDLLPEGVCKRRIMPCALKEAYVGKMVKVNNNNDGDRWSLISLGNSPGHKNVELKFVDTMRRQFEFSVDSFQIVLDSLLLFYDCAALPISENFYPTVVGESVYGDFQEALYHLQKKLISTRQPEEIRGGGLLKYCNLLVRNYKPVNPQHIKTLERYMCSRFFIDFPDINTQTKKLEAYLSNHFWGIDEEPLQYQYLMHLREVVEISTVCLMGHERRQTLLLIQTLAAQVLYKEQQKQHHAQEQYHQQQQQQHQQQQHHQQQQQQAVELQKAQSQQQQQQQVTLVTTQHHNQHQHHHQQQQQQMQAPPTQTIYVQQATAATSPQTAGGATTICCTTTASAEQQQQLQLQQQQQVQTLQTHAAVGQPATILVYNGVYYAPVIPAICTCNSTWLST